LFFKGVMQADERCSISELPRGDMLYIIYLGLLVMVAPGQAHAYIGPGAGFAIAGSFLVMFAAIVSALFLLLTWPVRSLVRAIRFRKVFARSRVKKVVVLGLDGLDYELTSTWMAEGKLPNFAKLRDQGCFKSLASTIPPISPVAWSSFQTGTNPGKHNIFDFLTRDRRTYAVKLSSTSIREPARSLAVGKYRIPLQSADIRLMRKGLPFWKILGDQGIFSSVIRVPITFPAEQFYGIQLSAMCVPDVRGTQGMFSYYTTESGGSGHNAGENFQVKRNGNTIAGELVGPKNPLLKNVHQLACPFVVSLNGPGSATLRIDGKTVRLKAGEYTDWIRVAFKASLGVRIRGICKFLLKSTEPEFRLYVTPINIDPEKPAMPISHPRVYSTYLSKRQGPYATLGLAEDTWALNEKLISDDDFLNQCRQHDEERKKMFFDSLDNVRRGLCVCVFDGTDRVQHTFWRQLDKEHPANRGDVTGADGLAIEEIYKRADTLLGKTLEKCNDTDTLLMVISDHGFSSFRYGVDVNRWLEENGYLKLKQGSGEQENLAAVDWSQTRAFAIGLAGLYLNLKGREAKGIVDPKTEAPGLRAEIARKLENLWDPARNRPAVKQVYNAWEVYSGPYRDDAPDLIVGYHAGYRASWETAVGKVTGQVFHDNQKAWSGDHCIDRSLVPGVLFCNRRIADEHPRLMDIGPTVLDLFGVKVPAHMDGRPLTVTIDGADAPAAA
jgi:predicted AlkP superfamily phosphohydrolase/phosphomutase